MKRLLPVMSLAACTSAATATSPNATIYDDGTTLWITGCSETGSQCKPAEGVTMTAIVDGQRLDVPVGQLPQAGRLVTSPQPEMWFHPYAFGLAVPSPTDSTIGIELDGSMTTVRVPAAFAIDAPSATLHRSAGPIRLRYDVVEGAEASPIHPVLVESTCKSSIYALREKLGAGVILTPGRMELDLGMADDALDCSHQVHIDQSTAVDEGVAIEAIRIGLAALTSIP